MFKYKRRQVAGNRKEMIFSYPEIRSKKLSLPSFKAIQSKLPTTQLILMTSRLQMLLTRRKVNAKLNYHKYHHNYQIVMMLFTKGISFKTLVNQGLGSSESAQWKFVKD